MIELSLKLQIIYLKTSNVATATFNLIQISETLDEILTVDKIITSDILSFMEFSYVIDFHQII